jgi:putative membrane-bound dehydrogenase-like protein
VTPSRILSSVGLLGILVPSLAPGLDQPVDLLADRNLDRFVVHLHPARSAVAGDAPPAFRFLPDGTLQISGTGWGTLRTRERYADCHLVLEYRWGEHTWKGRADKARDGGVFVHVQGPDAAIDGSWPRGVEAAILEGATGSLNVLGAASPRRLPATYRSPEWTDVRGFRGPDDAEEPFGDWNRLELICRGDSLSVRLNGRDVNTTSLLPDASGSIALQSEWAEWFVRRWELHPLDSFREPWQPPQRSADTGSGADLLPRTLPLPLPEALASFELDPAWTLELVAAEPLVSDPVDLIPFGPGRLLVAEMRDYPLPPEHGPNLSRLRLLTDDNGDGVMDRAVTWADALDHVQGLVAFRDGVLATSRTALLHLRDTDGDDRADSVRTLFRSNEPAHNQLQISSPRWSPDGWIYLNNGLDGKEIYPADAPDAKTAFARRNLRLNPKTLAMEPVSGFGQFGQTIDSAGRRYFSTNRSPILFAVLPLWALERNPHAHLAAAHEDIAPTGDAATVYPLTLSHTTSQAHLGTHTAACGLAWFQGDFFVCEPTGQLVTRRRPVPAGGSFTTEAVRPRPQGEFLRSRDEWFRPVNLRPGDDGCLYLCDMHRRFIDHARFFPESFSRTHYMRAGVDHGRIYRLRPKTPSPVRLPEIASTPETGSRLQELARAIAREGSLEVVPPVTEESFRKIALSPPSPRAGFLATLALGEFPSPAATSALATVARTRIDDAWTRRAVLSGAETRAGNILLAVGHHPDFPHAPSPAKIAFLHEFAAAVAARGDANELPSVLAWLAAGEGSGSWWQLAALHGLAEGFPRNPSVRSLAAFLAQPPAGSARSVLRVRQLLDDSASRAIDDSLPEAERLTALPLVRHLPATRAQETFATLLRSSQPPSVRAAAADLAGRSQRAWFIEHALSVWSGLDGPTRATVLSLLRSGTDSTLRMLRLMKEGTLNPALLDAMGRWSLLRSTHPEIKALAEELFARPSEDRAAVLASYRPALSAPGDAVRGREVFAATCAACHRVGSLGAEVGPDLTDVHHKPAEGLLSDILDPNRAMEARWIGWHIETKSGRQFIGLVKEETRDTVTIAAPGITESIPRQDIRSMKEQGASLMPVGIEATVNPAQMADLLAFLRSGGRQ